MKTARKALFFTMSIPVIAAPVVKVASLLNIPGFSGFFSKAEARTGRPLTPVSVAGAGRRTVRRCAAGVYNC
jgi:hypothetical protein